MTERDRMLHDELEDELEYGEHEEEPEEEEDILPQDRTWENVMNITGNGDEISDLCAVHKH